MSLGSFTEALTILRAIADMAIADESKTLTQKTIALEALNAAISEIDHALEREIALFAERMGSEVDCGYFDESERGYGTRYEE